MISMPAAPPAFAYGVAAAEVTQSSALVWTRAPHAGTVDLQLGAKRIRVEVGTSTDLTAQVRVKSLRPATRYTYRFVQGAARSRAGSFRTAPAPGTDAAV